MYSDLYPPQESAKTSIKSGSKIITPFEQLKKIVTDAAEFDVTHPIKEAKRISAHKRISLDKSLLKIHLKHSFIHNRLKEEKEFSEEHLSGKNEGKYSLNFTPGPTGGLYSDHEPGRVKAIRVKAIPDEPESVIVSKTTGKHLEERIAGRCGHSGIKEKHLNELNSDHPDKNPTRMVVVSNHISSRLNKSIELSDDESEGELLSRSKKRKLIRRVVVNHNQKHERGSLEVHKFSKESPLNEVISDGNSKNDEDMKGKQQIAVKSRIAMNTLQADLINVEKRSRRKSNNGIEPLKVQKFETLVNKVVSDGASKIDKGRKGKQRIEVKSRIGMNTVQADLINVRNSSRKNSNHGRESLKVQKFSKESLVTKVVSDSDSKNDKDRKGRQRTEVKSRVAMNALQADLTNVENRSRKNCNHGREPLKAQKYSKESLVNEVVSDRNSKDYKDRQRRQRIAAKNRIAMNTLQADLINVKNRRNCNRSKSPKWGHDGFQEICVDVGEQNDVKDRLNIDKVVGNEEDQLSDESGPRLHSKRRKMESDLNPMTVGRIGAAVSSDSDEWTEKEI